MRKTVLLGAATLLLGAGLAGAQPYSSYDRDDRLYDNRTESIIVRPDGDYIQKHQTVGRYRGEVNPTAYSLSRSVDLSDLDLSQPADRREMRNRVYETAVNLCYELDDRIPGLRDSDSGDKECVQTATRDALRDVSYQRYDHYRE